MRLIDADALKNLPFHRLIHTDFGETAVSFEEIDNAPTVEARPQGEWKVKTLSTFPQYQPDEYECPFCKTIVNYKTNFCHKCGADMRKGGAENG